MFDKIIERHVESLFVNQFLKTTTRILKVRLHLLVNL